MHHLIFTCKVNDELDIGGKVCRKKALKSQLQVLCWYGRAINGLLDWSS